MYWDLIKEGLISAEPASRKLALTILKQNLAARQEKSEEFELLWSTFFDIYDTLESFGSHLIKAIWDRSKIFFEHLKRRGPSAQTDYLLDMQYWLMTLLSRVGSHNNLKVRRYV